MEVKKRILNTYVKINNKFVKARNLYINVEGQYIPVNGIFAADDDLEKEDTQMVTNLQTLQSQSLEATVKKFIDDKINPPSTAGLGLNEKLGWHINENELVKKLKPDAQMDAIPEIENSLFTPISDTDKFRNINPRMIEKIKISKESVEKLLKEDKVKNTWPIKKRKLKKHSKKNSKIAKK